MTSNTGDCAHGLPLDAFKAFVRTTNGAAAVPPAVLSDDELIDITLICNRGRSPKRQATSRCSTTRARRYEPLRLNLDPIEPDKAQIFHRVAIFFRNRKPTFAIMLQVLHDQVFQIRSYTMS